MSDLPWRKVFHFPAVTTMGNGKYRLACEPIGCCLTEDRLNSSISKEIESATLLTGMAAACKVFDVEVWRR